MLREAITELHERFERMTVRQCFYQLESGLWVPKTESGYRRVQKEVLRLRREGLLPWSFIADGTRWQRKPSTWDNKADYMEAMFRGYRRDLWQRQNVRIEVWLEKDALADVVHNVTYAWDVSLMVSRGQSSATFINAAQAAAKTAAERAGVPTYIYLLYDFDAGRNRAARTIDRELSSGYVEVERLAVSEE